MELIQISSVGCKYPLERAPYKGNNLRETTFDFRDTWVQAPPVCKTLIEGRGLNHFVTPPMEEKHPDPKS